ncbi:hypothetical protein CAPTEDRAFT_195475 [Capitella teleta]|uniref:Reverse transcriptase domain-containing protein n=1 Tax=Capitella teleta TaxID=283909 RepID=R7V746_CAPTE|nr:hypothetical protein CAPTEDRAFT_195475 [Capitella teleta]|eukprot:ELU14404.1 hypothetical protein CAPTEDRAFT_195475 [Capitella teleta]
MKDSKQHNTLNQELVRLRATQQAAWRLHSTARIRETHQSLVTARQEFTLACANHIRRTDEATVKRMTESSNAKRWRKYFKQLYRGSAVKKAIPIMTVGTESYITAKDKAAVLNQTFFAKSRASSRPRFPSLRKRTDSALANILFNEYRVKNILQDLNINKASGPDGIQPSTLKNCSDSPPGYSIHQEFHRRSPVAEDHLPLKYYVMSLVLIKVPGSQLV